MARKYVEVIKNNTILFGSVFNNIIIKRESEDKTKTLSIKVPILYAGKEYFMYLLKNKLAKENQSKVQNIYPRMSFSLTDIQYNPSIKGNSNVIISGTNDTGDIEVQYNRIPYIFSYELNIAAVHQTDLFQIIEQILVKFKPSLNITAKLNPDIDDEAVDIPIILRNNKFQDFQNEVPFEDVNDKPIMHTISFDMKSWLYCTNENSGLSNLPIETVELGAWPWDTTINDVTIDTWYPIKIEE